MKTGSIFATIAATILGMAAQAQTPSPAAAPPAATAPAAAAKPATPPRTPDSAQTPELRGPDRHKDFLFRATQGDIGLLFMGDSITTPGPAAGSTAGSSSHPTIRRTSASPATAPNTSCGASKMANSTASTLK